MEQHNKIINDIAKRILKPAGLFRIGSSRLWIEDNGYFFTVVDFESSGYTKGTYLNVGIDFLWGDIQDNNEYLKYEIGGRVIVGKGTQFVEYRPNLKNCDAIFERDIEKFANTALLKVMEYRKYHDLDYAKKMLIRAVEDTPQKMQCWELYRLAMLCFFKGDYEEGKSYFYDYLDLTRNSFYKTVTVIQGTKKTTKTVHIDWLEEFYHYCLNTIIPQTETANNAQKMVYDKINKRRTIFSNKSSYRNMKKDIFYG